MKNKKTLIIVLMIFLLLLFVVPGFALDYMYPAEVERIIDGDTIVVDIELGLGVFLISQYIRLYGIDTWEITGEEKEQGIRARDYLVERLSSGEIQIKIEIRPEWGSNGKGKYGRWLGIIYVDGVNINALLVEKGHAQEYEEVAKIDER